MNETFDDVRSIHFESNTRSRSLSKTYETLNSRHRPCDLVH